MSNARKQAFIGGPDFEVGLLYLNYNDNNNGNLTMVLFDIFQEGPHCALNEEEFYDAMEMGLDRQEEQDEIVCSYSTGIPTSKRF